jgi:iron complex transport system permease protein
MHSKASPHQNPPKGHTWLWGLLMLIIAVTFILELSVGSIELSLKDLGLMLMGETPSKSHYTFIVFDIRLPRALTAICAGASLGVAGLLMQTLFRNPLAGPYVMGVSSGASLGVALITLGSSTFGYETTSGFSLSLAAGCGATLMLAFVLMMSRFVPGTMGLLLLGLMTGYAVGALVQILTYFSPAEAIKNFALWSMGDYSRLALEDLGWPSLMLGITLLLATLLAPQLNIFLQGENYARSVGVSIHKLRWILLILAGFLSGTITAMCGPIGFIGLTVPHIARRCFKSSDHSTLIPACILIGAALSLFADWLAQWPGSTRSLPLNAITALIGAPIVVFIIVKQGRRLQD